MNLKKLLLAFPLLFFSCMSIPEETVLISQNLGNDLEVLHTSHRHLVQLHFNTMKENINEFVENVYAPFVIHFVLSAELEAQEMGEESIYTVLETAGRNRGKKEAEEALGEMRDFLMAARDQIEGKRTELLAPIVAQEIEVLTAVDQSYQNSIYANSAITGHLRSMRRVKTSQQEALAALGLKNADQFITTNLARLSNEISEAVEQGKKLDIKSEDAYKKIENVVDQIKKTIK